MGSLLRALDLNGLQPDTEHQPEPIRYRVSRSTQKKIAATFGGRRLRAVLPKEGERPVDLSVMATMQAAAIRRTGGRWQERSAPAVQSDERTLQSPAQRIVERADLKVFVREKSKDDLVVFVVDLSDSMTSHRQQSAAKQTVLALLRHRSRARTRAAIIAFGGRKPRLVLPPTTSYVRAFELLGRIPAGGATPLADALRSAAELVATEQRRCDFRRAVIVLLSDGEGNVRLSGTSDRTEERKVLRRVFAGSRAELVCADTLPASAPARGFSFVTRSTTPMKVLADELGAVYIPLGID